MSTFRIMDPKGRVVHDSNARKTNDDPMDDKMKTAYGRASYGGGYARGDYEVEAMRSRAEAAERALAKLSAEPTIVGYVTEVRGDRMVVGLGPGGVFEISKLATAKVGDRVLLKRDTLQAIEIESPEASERPAGSVVNVERSGDYHVEAKLGPELRTFRCMLPEQAKAGDRVVLDPSMTFVVGNLGPPPSPLAYTPKIAVAWDDIGGQDEAKEALRDAIELPAAHPALFAAYGKTPSKGVLLAGPPGTGKTMLAKAAATSLARVHGATHASGFVYVKGPELLSGWIGQTEQAIRQVFAGAREHRQKHPYPCVVFVDECEALFKRRGDGSGPGYDYSMTVVPQFLAEMDGMDETACLFILATNRPDTIDPAVLRDGRVDRKVHVGRPGKADVARIAEIKLKAVPLRDASSEHLAETLWSDDRVVWSGEVYGRAVCLRLRDLASGALVAGIVDQATTFAVRRDVDKGRKASSGVTQDDVTQAIERKLGELARQDHREVIAELIKGAP